MVDSSSPKLNHTHTSGKPFVCPWWLGYVLLIPFRRFSHNPEKILGPYVREGMTVLEVGPGMGYFSLPLARLVSGRGRIVCVDLQEKMLESLRKRASRADLGEMIETRLASETSLQVNDLTAAVDFVLAFAVVHEVLDKRLLFEEIHRTMKPAALMLFSEPTGHVSEREFNDTLAIALKTGFESVETLKIRRCYSVLMKKG